MFSNLDNFFAESEIKVPVNDVSTASPSAADESGELDLSDTYNPKSKQKQSDDGPTKLAKPKKGQKMAAKRVQKIGETLENKLVDMEQIEKRIQKQKISKAVQKKSPPKRNGRPRQSPRSRRRMRRGIDPSRYEDPGSSDSEIDDPNTIVLDCDFDFKGGPAVAVTRDIAGANTISVEDAMSMKVSVIINNKIELFEMNAYQKISVLIGKISDMKKVPADHISLMFNDKTVAEHETPKSIGYIQGLVMKAHITETANQNKNIQSSTSNSKKLEIKIQAEGLKRPFITHINPTDELTTLAFACAAEFKCDINKVALEFDGDFINFKETAEDLGLEGGEVMDFFRKK